MDLVQVLRRINVDRIAALDLLDLLHLVFLEGPLRLLLRYNTFLGLLRQIQQLLLGSSRLFLKGREPGFIQIVGVDRRDRGGAG